MNCTQREWQEGKSQDEFAQSNWSRRSGFGVWGGRHGVVGDKLDEGVGDEEGGEAEGTVLEESEAVAPADDAEAEDDGGDLPLPGRPKLLITPIFHDFFRFFPVSPGTFGRAPWIPGVQTLKMGERWGKMG